MHYGQTDDFSYNVVKDPVHVRDLHATMLHLLGVDHNQLTFPFQGLDQKLTGVEAAGWCGQLSLSPRLEDQPGEYEPPYPGLYS